jgi:hypothetical protein
MMGSAAQQKLPGDLCALQGVTSSYVQHFCCCISGQKLWHIYVPVRLQSGRPRADCNLMALRHVRGSDGL